MSDDYDPSWEPQPHEFLSDEELADVRRERRGRPLPGRGKRLVPPIPCPTHYCECENCR